MQLLKSSTLLVSLLSVCAIAPTRLHAPRSGLWTRRRAKCSSMGRSWSLRPLLSCVQSGRAHTISIFSSGRGLPAATAANAAADRGELQRDAGIDRLHLSSRDAVASVPAGERGADHGNGIIAIVGQTRAQCDGGFERLQPEFWLTSGRRRQLPGCLRDRGRNPHCYAARL